MKTTGSMQQKQMSHIHVGVVLVKVFEPRK